MASGVQSPTRFLVLGAGGLGCPALLALAAHGAEHITIVDDDVVDTSNLHRQVLYDMASVGAPKVEAARRRLGGLAPGIEVHAVRRRVDESGLAQLLDGVPRSTVVLECSDSPALKFALNDQVMHREMAAVIGGVIGWRGQALAIAPGAACYRCYYEAPPPPELAPACATVGVMGAVAGQIGGFMALLAVRLQAEPAGGKAQLAGRLHVFDGLIPSARELRAAPRRGCPGHPPSRIAR